MCRNLFRYKRINNILHQEGCRVLPQIIKKKYAQLGFFRRALLSTTRIRNNDTCITDQ